MSLSDLPTLADRPRMACPKGPTRLQVTAEARRLTVVNEKKFRAAVIARDKGLCRCCGRKTVQTISRIEERAEVHHVHGRTGDLRHEVRAALLLCAGCHERVTGKVNEKVRIEPTKWFHIRQDVYTDATFPVTFRDVA